MKTKITTTILIMIFVVGLVTAGVLSVSKTVELTTEREVKLDEMELLDIPTTMRLIGNDTEVCLRKELSRQELVSEALYDGKELLIPAVYETVYYTIIDKCFTVNNNDSIDFRVKRELETIADGNIDRDDKIIGDKEISDISVTAKSVDLG